MTVTLKRPDWWKPGMPLPPISAIRTYSGQGAIPSMKGRGACSVQLTTVRWETLDEWQSRK